MDGYSAALMYFAAGTTRPDTQTDGCEEPTHVANANRSNRMPPKPPRTSPATDYSSKTPCLGQRLCIWVKEKFNALNSARLKFAYDIACRETLLALDWALILDNPVLRKQQLLNFEKCYARRVPYLDLQTPEKKKELIDQFRILLENRCSDDIERFDDLRKAMEAQKRSDLNRWLNHKPNANRGYAHASNICSTLSKVLHLPRN
jgi:hypothetical protein